MQRPGLYAAHVDGIAYTIEKLNSTRWKLVGTVGPTPCVVMATNAETATALRSYARINHDRTLATLYASSPTRGTAVIGDAILTACRLPDASFTLTDEGNGWMAAYAMRAPGRTWIRMHAFKASAADALRQLDLRVRGELADGGRLHAELIEFAR